MPRCSILIVDDDPDIRDTVSNIVNYAGYGVRTANDGADAPGQLQTGANCDLILLDLMMPHMSGWDS